MGCAPKRRDPACTGATPGLGFNGAVQLRRDFALRALRRLSSGVTRATFGPLAQAADVFRHQLRERHEIHEHLADGQVSRFLLPGEPAIERVNEDRLDLRAGQPLGDLR